MIGCHVRGVDEAVELTDQLPLHRFELLFGEVAPADAALVGHDDGGPSEGSGPGQFRHGTLDGAHVLRITAMVDFLHECPVPVEEEGGTACSAVYHDCE